MAKRGRPKGTPGKYYTVYLRKTDEIIAFGTSESCALQLGFKNPHSFQSIVSKTKKGLTKKYEFVVEKSAHDEEMEK